jgi:pilus assembly protein Flp/PilA
MKAIQVAPGLGEGLIKLARRDRMHPYARAIVAFLENEGGPTAVEYAVMLALVIVVCIGAITTLGKNANRTFDSVGDAITSSS